MPVWAVWPASGPLNSLFELQRLDLQHDCLYINASGFRRNLPRLKDTFACRLDGCSK